jgi:ribulose-phosphate 3-epimerase
LVLPAKSTVTFHIETKNDINELINKIKEKNWQPSIAMCPKTAPEKTFPFLQQIDHLLVMSVNPGFSGQQFMPSALDSFRAIGDYCSQHNLKVTLAADGGINKHNIAQLATLGVQDFAVASAIFESTDPVQAINELQKLVEK